jgi:hypothetical protein
MVRAQPFSGFDNKDPLNHLQELEKICSCLSIPGITQEILKWKLFPFSLMGEAKRWYTNAIGSMNGDWEELKRQVFSSILSYVPYQLPTKGNP